MIGKSSNPGKVSVEGPPGRDVVAQRGQLRLSDLNGMDGEVLLRLIPAAISREEKAIAGPV